MLWRNKMKRDMCYITKSKLCRLVLVPSPKTNRASRGLCVCTCASPNIARVCKLCRKVKADYTSPSISFCTYTVIYSISAYIDLSHSSNLTASNFSYSPMYECFTVNSFSSWWAWIIFLLFPLMHHVDAFCIMSERY